jgi:hypothetical protein
MRVERLLTLELSDEPGQGNALARGRIVRGRCVMGDRPDFGIDVSVRCVLASEAGRLLDAARMLALHPMEGLASVVDLAMHDLEAIVSYRWVEGKSLAKLMAESALTEPQARVVIESVGRILERMARGPLRDVPAPSLLTPEQVLVTPEDEVRIVDWAIAGSGHSLDVGALLRGLERGVFPQTLPAPKVAAPVKTTAGGFDAALAAALSIGSDSEVARSPTQAAPPVSAASLPHLAWPTVSGKQVSSRPAPVEAPAAPSPRRSRAVDLLLGAFGGALLAIGVVALVMQSRGARDETARPTASPPARVVANPTPPVAPVVTPVVMIDASTPPPTELAHAKPSAHAAHPTAAAHAFLSIATDVPAAVYLDDQYLGDTPLTKRSVASGHHHLRLEALEQSMRLLPRESDVTFVAGEESRLRFGLR